MLSPLIVICMSMVTGEFGHLHKDPWAISGLPLCIAYFHGFENKNVSLVHWMIQQASYFTTLKNDGQLSLIVGAAVVLNARQHFKINKSSTH